MTTVATREKQNKADIFYYVKELTPEVPETRQRNFIDETVSIIE